MSGVTGSGAGQNGKSNNTENVTNMAELNKGIRREVTRLSERWSALLVHVNQWQAKLDDMLPVSHLIVFTLSHHLFRKHRINHIE